MIIYLAADHAGFALKNSIRDFLQAEGYAVEDCGVFAYDEADDYPEIIAAAGRKLSANPDNRAIVFGGSGQGEAIVMNRFSNVRCALFYGDAGTQTDAGGNTFDIVESTRQHNDANALSIGARFVTEEGAKKIVKKFIDTPFGAVDRHVRRIKKIDAIV